jgi:hypothetical protein
LDAVLRAFPVLLCLLICSFGLAGSLIASGPRDDRAIAALFPPWWSPATRFSAAGSAGEIVDAGAFPFILIIQSDRPGLADRLRAAGALLLVNPFGAGGCRERAMRNSNV